MTVAASDMKWFLSGGGGNTNPNNSLGGARSSTQITSNVVENLFDNVTGDEAIAGTVEYRCAYLKNDHATDALEDVLLWIASNTPSSSTIIAIALDPNLLSPGGAVTPSPQEEDVAPPGVDFALSPLPTSEGTAINIGDMAAQSAIAVWFRRTVTAGAAAVANDPCTVTLKGTPA